MVNIQSLTEVLLTYSGMKSFMFNPTNPELEACQGISMTRANT